MDKLLLILAVSLIAYCGLRLVGLFLNQKAVPASAGTYRPINKAVCQNCEEPLPLKFRLIGILHCSRECREAERLKLAGTAEALSGGPLFL